MFKKKSKKIEESPVVIEQAVITEAEEIKETKSLDNSDLKDLIEKNIKWSQVIYHQNKQIKNRLTMMSTLAWLKMLLIVVPIILGIIYLQPIIEDAWKQYSQLLSGEGSGEMGGSGVNLNEILKQLK